MKGRAGTKASLGKLGLREERPPLDRENRKPNMRERRYGTNQKRGKKKWKKTRPRGLNESSGLQCQMTTRRYNREEKMGTKESKLESEDEESGGGPTQNPACGGLTASTTIFIVESQPVKKRADWGPPIRNALSYGRRRKGRERLRLVKFKSFARPDSGVT